MLGGTLGREGQHRHAGLLEPGHALGGLRRADGDLGQLLGIRGGGHGHVADYQHAVLTVLRGLGDHQHRTAHAGDARGALDDLEGGTQGLAGGGEGAADLAVRIAALDDEAAEIQRIQDHFAGLFQGHALLLAELEQQLGIILRLFTGGGIDNGRISDVGQAQGCGIGKDLLPVADQDDVGQAVRDSAVGGGDGTLLEGLGKHDALPVGAGTRNDTFNQ